VDLYDVMRTTFAAREFTDEPLPDRTLYRILDNARFAPSGGNRQAVRIIVVRDQKTRDRLAELSMPGARRYVAQLGIGEAPWNPLRPSGVPPADVDTTEVPETFIAPVRRASVVLVVCLDLRYVAATDQGLSRVGVVSGASVFPLVWNILLATRGEGYGGNISTMVVPQEPEVQKLLGIPDFCAVAAVLALGKPTRQLTRLRRKTVDDFVTWERFDGPAYTFADQPRANPDDRETRGTG
jgi:nitroreductase